MSARIIPSSIPAAAAELGHDPAALRCLIDDAAYASETPSANTCVLPGPPLELRIELAGRQLSVRRESERADWLILLPA
jgi:hypothetical protein